MMMPVPTDPPVEDSLSIVTTLGAMTLAAFATLLFPIWPAFKGAAVISGALLLEPSRADDPTIPPRTPPANAVVRTTASAIRRGFFGRLVGICGGVLTQVESLLMY
jgi:hypothetical protein